VAISWFRRAKRAQQKAAEDLDRQRTRLVELPIADRLRASLHFAELAVLGLRTSIVEAEKRAGEQRPQEAEAQ
jgi:hypothetical protein